nr:hypothetical protein [Wadden Sea poxvirus]
MDHNKTVITQFGVIYLQDENINYKIYSDLGIVNITNIGPYNICGLDITYINIDDISSCDLYDCYISYKGIIYYCSNNNRLNVPITNIYSAFLTNEKLLICCDEYPMIHLNEYIQKFYIGYSIDILYSNILEIYNLYQENDYHFILNPSFDFLKSICEKVDICLTDYNGWVIVDYKNQY